MRNKTGGPAFPTPRFTMDGEGRVLGFSISTDGMSLRDYFAAKAMQAMITNETVHATSMKAAHEAKLHEEFVLAQMSYMLADAMLKAREE
jgi:hypothetical protein